MKVFSFVFFLYFIIQSRALKLYEIKGDVLPTKEQCGHNNQLEAFQFPWIVHIPLETRTYNPSANVRCTGVLISKRYVLTAKTCLQFVLTKVHVGQYNTSLDNVCSGNECSSVVKLNVEEKVVDEVMDVVLLRLAEDVQFAENIAPICLPFDDFPKATTGATVYSSGWGLRSLQEGFSLIKKTVKQTLISNDDCKKSSNFQGAVNDKLICVKLQADSVDKPCNGDEGTPVMFKSDNQWIVEGVLNWFFDSGDKPCTMDNPTRGTRITTDVLEWIVEKIRP